MRSARSLNSSYSRRRTERIPVIPQGRAGAAAATGTLAVDEFEAAGDAAADDVVDTALDAAWKRLVPRLTTFFLKPTEAWII